MGKKMIDPYSDIEVEMDDDITEEQAKEIFAADADDAPRYEDMEAGK